MIFLYYLSLFLIVFPGGCSKKNRFHSQQKINNVLPPPPELIPLKEYDYSKTHTQNHVNEEKRTTKKNIRPLVKAPDVKDTRVSSVYTTEENNVSIEALRVQSPKEQTLPLIKSTDALSIRCTNKTNRPLIICCFYYTKLRTNAYWRWVKSPLFSLDMHQVCNIPIKATDDLETKQNIFGYIGVFNTYEEAQNATYESLNDNQKIDLDRLLEHRNKTIEIVVDHYGFKKEQLDYQIKEKKTQDIIQPELDFMVENQTGKTIWVTCFVYQKTSEQDSLVSWKYDKTKVHKLEPGEIATIDVETIRELYDWIYMRGFLAVFDEQTKQEAFDATYELLKPEQKIGIGRLADILGTKITLSIEKYGPAQKIFEFQQTKPARIDFTKRKKHRAIF